MGIVSTLLATLFGGGRNAVAETVGLFRENTELAAERQAAYRAAALGQFAAEFAVERKGLFDRFMDGLNRVPRPAMALGTIGLIAAAMVNPIWFSSRMQGLALVPEPLWWLLGAVVSFYFGARYQVKSQDFDRSLAQTLGRVTQVGRNLEILAEVNSSNAGNPDLSAPDNNPALRDWRDANDG